MGLFGSLKKAFNHGGVEVDFEAPTTISRTAGTLPISVTVTATDEAHTIVGLSAEIVATSYNQNFNSATTQNQAGEARVVARVDKNETFSLAPGESKTEQMEITMNGGLEALVKLTGLDPNSKGGKLASALLSTLNNGGADSYTYTLTVSADVDGIKLDPSKQQALRILAPGEISIGFGTHT